ncbi:MAG: hypothetical protein HY719_16480, partial [Planctomycetes bacterium]|nr:hypothetical protein [Planctomycetota bacterium]
MPTIREHAGWTAALASAWIAGSLALGQMYTDSHGRSLNPLATASGGGSATVGTMRASPSAVGVVAGTLRLTSTNFRAATGPVAAHPPVGLIAPLFAGTTAPAETAITWKWADLYANGQNGFRLYDTGGVQRAVAGTFAAQYQESDLAPNTPYARSITEFKGAAESARSAPYTRHTLANVPGAITFGAAAAGTMVAVSWNPNFNPLGTTYDLQYDP